MRLIIPEKHDLVKTSIEDPVEYYYTPILGWLYRRRLEMGLGLIGNNKRQKVLDIGYGSGIQFSELNKRFQRLYGCDIHSQAPQIKRMFKRENIDLQLVRASILNLSYKNNTFDTVVCISTLEHMRELDKANFEIQRVLKQDGTAIIGFPSSGRLMRFLFAALLIRHVRHVSDENAILGSLKKFFDIKSLITFPRLRPLNLSLYFCCQCGKKNE
jgi:ubiquinone/menaquinone biosynthesis C-methylase UbiE